jgi:AraC family ethanolamine operon transcriptional activator
MQRCIQGADIDVVPLAPGPFRGEVIASDLNGILVNVGQFRGSLRSRGTLHKTHITFGLQIAVEPASVQWNNEVVAGNVLTMPPATEQEGASYGLNDYATVSMDLETLAELGVLHAIDADDRFFSRRRHFIPAPTGVRTAVATAMGQFARALADRTQTATPDRIESLRRSVIMPFLVGISYGYEPRGRLTQRPAAQIVRLTENWIDERPSAHLHILDVCRALNISMRTLQRAFQRTLGMAPSRYLMLRRLSRARNDFLSADQRQRTVTDVAAAHGFFEPGRFAGLYKHFYQESPSHTLLHHKRATRTLSRDSEPRRIGFRSKQ